MNRRSERFALAAIVIGGFLLRAIGLGRESYWFDELLSLSLVEKPVRALVHELAVNDVHPPLFFVLLRGVRLAFGTSEIATRSLSLFAGTGAIAAAYALARALWKRPFVALFAAALVAVSPISVYYARELRPYALLELLVLASTAFLVRASSRRFSFASLALYAPIAALLPYTHVFGVFTLAAHAVYFAAHRDRRTLLRGALTLAFVALAYLPWLPITLHQIAHVEHGFWIERPDLAVYWKTLRAEGTWSLSFVVLTSFFALATIVESFRRDRVNGVLLGASIALPTLVPMAMSWLSQPIFMGKYAIGAAAILLVAAAPSIDDLARAHAPAVAAAFTICGFGETVRDVHARDHHEQWREVAAFFADESAQGRPTVLWHDYRGFFAYYLGRPRAEATFWMMWRWELTTEYREGIVSRLHALGSDRFWVLRMRDEDDPALEEVLRARFVPIRTARWIGAEATEWQIPSAMAIAPPR